MDRAEFSTTRPTTKSPKRPGSAAEPSVAQNTKSFGPVKSDLVIRLASFVRLAQSDGECERQTTKRIRGFMERIVLRMLEHNPKTGAVFLRVRGSILRLLIKFEDDSASRDCGDMKLPISSCVEALPFGRRRTF